MFLKKRDIQVLPIEYSIYNRQYIFVGNVIGDYEYNINLLLLFFLFKIYNQDSIYYIKGYKETKLFLDSTVRKVLKLECK